MRIKKITLENFRFFKSTEIDLSADVIAIYGRNGVGKTSIFDAIEFALMGSIGRHDDLRSLDYLHNVYSTEPLRVKIDFQNSDSQWIQALKETQSPIIAFSGSKRAWKEQKDFLYDVLVNENYQSGRKELGAVAELIRATILLSQDSIREFVDGTPQQRTGVITNIAGNAYWQRGLSKAEDVEKKINQMSLDEATLKKAHQINLQTYHSEVDKVDAKIKNLNHQQREEINGVTFTVIKKKLRSLGLDANDDEPHTIEQLEGFVSSIRNFSDTQFEYLVQKSNSLAEVEGLSVQHVTCKKRIEELKSLLDKCKEKLSRLQKLELELSTMLEEKRKELIDIRENIKLRTNNITSYQELTNFRLTQSRLLNSLNEIKEKINKIEERKKALEDIYSSKQKAILELRESEKRLKNAIEIDNAKILAFRSLKDGHQPFVQNNALYEELTNRHKELSEKIFNLQKAAKNLSERKNNAQNLLISANSKIEAIKNNISEIKTLVTAIKQHASGNACPVCGHEHLNEAALKQAIDNQIKIVPQDIQVLFEESTGLKTTIDGLDRELADLNGQLATAKESLRDNDKQRSETLIKINDYNQHLKSSFSGGSIVDLDKKIVEMENIVLDRQSQIQTIQQQLQKDSINLRDVAKDLEECASGYQKDVSTYNERRSALQQIEVQIMALGLNDEINQSNEELARRIQEEKTLLAGIETKRKNLELKISEIENSKTKHLAELRFVIDEIKKNEEERILLGIQVDTYLNKCKELEIDEEKAASSIQKERLEISKKQDQINLLLRNLDSYKLRASIAIIQDESKGLRLKLAEYEKSYQESQIKIDSLNKAGEEISTWKAKLNSHVSASVEKTINYYLPDIWRLFKVMIPMPHMFEAIQMCRSQEGGIDLQLKYAKQKDYVGEPKYFLSSAQANILALALFITLASRQQWSALDSILLDDPVQHLDDLDAVSFLDAIRSLALGYLGPKRQIILSTCDLNLYLLILKKFSFIDKAGVSFTGISIVNDGISADIQYDVQNSKR